MDRLTKREKSGDAVFIHGTCFCPNEVCERLAAYEDSGLTPEEIKALQAVARGMADRRERHHAQEVNGDA